MCGAARIRHPDDAANSGSCGIAESREPILAVAQLLADEMRRHADRSSHAHKMPADGNGAITGDVSLFLPG